MTQRSKKKPTITLIADFGGSASKFFYQVEGQWRSCATNAQGGTALRKQIS